MQGHLQHLQGFRFIDRNIQKHVTTVMAQRTQHLREDGRKSSSDSLATTSSYESEGLLGHLTSSSDPHGARTPEIMSPPEKIGDFQVPENIAAEDRVKSEKNEKGLHDAVRAASIPVRLEKVKNGGKGSYMLRMDDDLRELLSQSRSAGVNGKKRRAKFTDVGLHSFSEVVALSSFAMLT